MKKTRKENSAQGQTIVITESININCNDILDVDSSIIEQMKERLIQEQINHIIKNDPLNIL